MLRERFRLITINKLVADGKISVRTSNCCYNAKLESVLYIIKYKENGQSFLNIRNAGRKTYLELETIYKEYSSPTNMDFFIEDVNQISKEDEDPLQRQQRIENLIKTDTFHALENNLIEVGDVLAYLNDVQRDVLKEKFYKLISDCSNRTKKRLTSIGFESYIFTYLFSPDTNLLKVDGLGKRSLNEIVNLKNRMKSELLNQINLSDEEKSTLNLVRQKGDIILNEFVYNFYIQNNYLPMFWILEQQLITNNNRDIEILIDTFPIFQNKKQLSLDKVAEMQGLSRERVRQIRNKVFHETFEIADEIIDYKADSNIIKYIELLQRKDDWSYFFHYMENNECITHNDDRIHRLLKKEQSNLSFQFVLQVVANVYKDKYCLIGGFDTFEKNKTWENTFLIKKELIDIFDFTRLKEEFELLLMNNTSDYFLDINKNIENSQCWIKFDFDKIDSIVATSRDILLHEFGLSTEDFDGYLKIPANKERNPIDALYDILQEKGEPMSIEDIFIEFKKIFPFHKYIEANQLRPYLYKNEAITHRNRSSIYTLKEWKHIKAGTIRDAIVEFLINNALPQTVENITQEILQYFPETNLASVKATISSDPKKRFSFFGNNLFGLRNKQYPSEYEEIEQQEKQRKSIEQRLTNLEKFLVENEHFPFSSSKDEEEESLNRWWARIIKGSQPLNEKQQTEVNRIKEQYADYETDKSVYEWSLNYNKLRVFLLENQRPPSAIGDEKFLYGWLRRAKNNFLNNNLREDQRKKYIELAKII